MRIPMITDLVTTVADPASQVTIVEVTKDRVVTDSAPIVPPESAALDADPVSQADDGVKDLVKVFKLLSDETRLRIVLCLIHGELHVRALCERLRQSQPAVSHHLALLRVAGLIQCRRQGKHNFYRIEPGHFRQLIHAVFAHSPRDAC
jgi:DNA-binding transcriptional ArsR family regulator